VAFTAPGMCTLTAHVSAGATFGAADGNLQSFVVSQATPTTPNIANIPSDAAYAESVVAVVLTNGDGTKSVTSSTGGVCTVGNDGLTVAFTGIGMCTLTAHVSTGLLYGAADGSAQSFDVSGTTVTPFISNIPSDPAFGGSFVASVQTNGDGTKSVTSSTNGVCKVGTDGLTVTFATLGTCTLTPHVSAGAVLAAADGSPQSLIVSQATPTAPAITNLPTGGNVGGRFTASVSTSSTGKTSVMSQTPTVCAVAGNGLKVTFVASGLCALVPSVAATKNYLQASGAPQDITISG